MAVYLVIIDSNIFIDCFVPGPVLGSRHTRVSTSVNKMDKPRTGHFTLAGQLYLQLHGHMASISQQENQPPGF